MTQQISSPQARGFGSHPAPDVVAALDRDGGADASWTRSNGRFALAIAGVLVLAAVVALTGSISIAPEAHDVYNAQTAYEMYHRPSWLVPYFNDHVRLNKPPLSYWVTLGIGAVTGAHGDITVWHSRVMSTLGGLGMIAAAIVIGCVLFNRITGLAAGLMTATSLSFFSLAHSGRPDMLYAGFCAAQAALLVLAWAAADRSLAQRLFAYASWVLVGLAVMTKGPQMPPVMLVAMISWMAARREGLGRIMRVTRPIEGLILATLIAVPWFVYIKKTVAIAADPKSNFGGGEEFEGRDLAINWLAPIKYCWYYPWAVIRMMLPWPLTLVPMVIAAVVPWSRRSESRLLLVMVVLCMVLFSFGDTRRVHYMLPILPVASVLTVVGVTLLLPKASAGRVAGVLLVIGVVLSAGYIALGGRESMWGGTHLPRAQFMEDLARRSRDGLDIVGYRTECSLLIYDTRKPVSVIETHEALRKRVETTPRGRLGVVIQKDRLNWLPPEIASLPIALEEQQLPGESRYVLVIAGTPTATKTDPTSNNKPQ
jgi:4-amino-4-deoxy-L-arabinose transferase-like glycosyltransferase